MMSETEPQRLLAEFENLDFKLVWGSTSNLSQTCLGITERNCQIGIVHTPNELTLEIQKCSWLNPRLVMSLRFLQENKTIVEEVTVKKDFHESPRGFKRCLWRRCDIFPSNINHLSCNLKFLNPNFDATPPIEVESTLGANLERLRIEDPELADIEIVCDDGKTIPAMSAVLKAKSKVFEAMLTHDTEEKRTKQIKIQEASSETVEAFIKFLHSENQEIQMGHEEILPIADYYQVHDLKIVCENNLIKKLRADNVPEMIGMANQYNAKNLETACSAFNGS